MVMSALRLLRADRPAAVEWISTGEAAPVAESIFRLALSADRMQPQFGISGPAARLFPGARQGPNGLCLPCREIRSPPILPICLAKCRWYGTFLLTGVNLSIPSKLPLSAWSDCRRIFRTCPSSGLGSRGLTAMKFLLPPRQDEGVRMFTVKKTLLALLVGISLFASTPNQAKAAGLDYYAYSLAYDGLVYAGGGLSRVAVAHDLRVLRLHLWLLRPDLHRVRLQQLDLHLPVRRLHVLLLLGPLRKLTYQYEGRSYL